jgi:hypothetical protein
VVTSYSSFREGYFLSKEKLFPGRYIFPIERHFREEEPFSQGKKGT